MSGFQTNNAIVKWIAHRLPVFSFMNHELNEYPTPKNLNYFWNFGSLAGIALVIMIATGIVLAISTSSGVCSLDPTRRHERFCGCWVL